MSIWFVPTGFTRHKEGPKLIFALSSQCGQMARLFFQYLAACKNKHLPNSMKISQSRFKFLPRTKQTLQELPKTLIIGNNFLPNLVTLYAVLLFYRSDDGCCVPVRIVLYFLRVQADHESPILDLLEVSGVSQANRNEVHWDRKWHDHADMLWLRSEGWGNGAVAIKVL